MIGGRKPSRHELRVTGLSSTLGVLSVIPTAQRNTRQSGAGLKILSAGSTLYGLRGCAEMFGRERGIPVQVATDHGHHIHQAALRGEADADVVLLPADMTAALAAAGVADDGTKVAIGSVRIGAAVHADAPVPDVSTVAALRNALLAADAVLLTRAPTGDHLLQAIARVGVAEAIADKLQRFDTSTLLNRHLADRADRRPRSASAPPPKSSRGTARASYMPAPYPTRCRSCCPMGRPC